MMSNIEIHQIKSPSETEELDWLLWEVLWKPLELPRNIRDSFKLEGEHLELGARIDNAFIGGLVANWTSPTEVEIRHLAVKPQNQNQCVGTQLVARLLENISGKSCARVYAIARNTSAGFFRRLGFTTAPGEPPEHPLFKKQGITFELLEKNIGP
jgi:GNAT superfamily N-acetyltransferase